MKKRKKKVILSRHVLGVNDLAASTDYYTNVLGFARDFSAPGWESLSLGEFHVLLGECPNDPSAHTIGDHAYFAYVYVKDAAALSESFRANGAVFRQDVADKPWGMREFEIETPDGHRMVFGEEL